MRKRWILIALSVGLLAALVTGGVALAWGREGPRLGLGPRRPRRAEVGRRCEGIRDSRH